MTYAAVPLAANIVVVKLNPKHQAVLQGLALRNPYLSLSDILEAALEPFCQEHADAAGENTLQIDIT